MHHVTDVICVHVLTNRVGLFLQGQLDEAKAPVTSTNAKHYCKKRAPHIWPFISLFSSSLIKKIDMKSWTFFFKI